MKKLQLLSATLAATLTLFSPLSKAEEANYILATASTGGTYYPVGVALATLVKVKLQPTENIAMSAISSAGSGENIRLLREDEAQFAILQGLYGLYAAKGTGPMEEAGPQEELRSITMLWQNVEQFAINKADATTGTIDDLVALKGEKMALGAQNSGSLGSNISLLEGLGINAETDYELVYGGYGPAADALQNGQVKGISTPSGVPAGAISKLLASVGDNVTLLNFTPEQLAKADNGRELWTPYLIPANTYPGQTADINTIAQPNFLATTSRESEENVYLITKAIYENLPFLNAIHSATKVMAVEKALAGLPLPLHAGALRYYQEVGVTVPERLIAK